MYYYYSNTVFTLTCAVGEKCVNMCKKKKDTKNNDPTRRKISPIISKSESSIMWKISSI